MNAIQTLLTDHLGIWTAADTEKKSGRGRSSGNADRVYGIRKLRELILELAVRGKLVPQVLNDEPASELLKRIQAEKTKLIAEGKIKKDKPLTLITEDEKPFELPQGWEWTRVAQVGHDWGQKSPDSDFTYIEVSAIDSQRGVVSSPELVKPENAPSRARKVVKQGSVIYSTIRPYLLNVAVIEDDFSPEPIASTAFAIVHPFCLMPPRYFLCFFRSPVFVRHVESVQMGIAYPAINDGQFFSSLIPLPPIEEQHRIVAKVDELMALCDQLEQQQTDSLEAHQTLVETLLGTLTRVESQQEFSAAWARIASHFDTLFTTEASIDQLKQTILQLAVMGKLVPQDPDDEPAEADFNSLVRTRENSPLKRTKIDEEVAAEDPLIPDTWMSVSLGELISIRTGFAFKSGDYAEHGTFILRVTNINPDGSFDTSNAVFLPEAKLDDKMRGYLLEEHELLVVMVGGSLGKIGQVTAEILPALLNQNMWRLKPYSDRLDYRFLRLVLHDLNENRLQITPSTHGHLAMGTYAAAKVPFPPLAEQHRIVAKVDELMALCDTLKARLADAQTIQLHLADAIVEQAVC